MCVVPNQKIPDLFHVYKPTFSLDRVKLKLSTRLKRDSTVENHVCFTSDLPIVSLGYKK